MWKHEKLELNPNCEKYQCCLSQRDTFFISLFKYFYLTSNFICIHSQPISSLLFFPLTLFNGQILFISHCKSLFNMEERNMLACYVMRLEGIFQVIESARVPPVRALVNILVICFLALCRALYQPFIYYLIEFYQ